MSFSGELFIKFILITNNLSVHYSGLCYYILLMCLFYIFYTQMVATEDTGSVSGQIDSPGTFGKLRQTLSSSLLTAQDKGKVSLIISQMKGQFTSVSHACSFLKYGHLNVY